MYDIAHLQISRNNGIIILHVHATRLLGGHAIPFIFQLHRIVLSLLEH